MEFTEVKVELRQQFCPAAKININQEELFAWKMQTGETIGELASDIQNNTGLSYLDSNLKTWRDC